MRKTKVCQKCGKEFNTYWNCKYCSYECYWNSRWGMKTCKGCGKKIARLRYCSDKCRQDYWNKNDYHLFKKAKYWKQKLELIKELGGKCIKCGISDIRVLDINHKDRKKKILPPKLRYTWQRRLKDWKKNKQNLELLCSNCHRIHTWKQRNYGHIAKKRIAQGTLL